ncbi:MAG: NADH-quinone oxidoreductase subunit L [Pseudomonadaceae bacterium]|nr:NADH-quinone oxidoreductase subunit L [Pseudomonadaceae bacterium]
MTHLPTILILLPLLGALAGALTYLWPTGAKRRSNIRTLEHSNIRDTIAMATTTGSVVLAAVLAWTVFLSLWLGGGAASHVDWFTWLNAGPWQVTFGALTDKLSATMYVVVATVSACVHVYSIGYMHEDASRRRFFIYLSAFTFAMLMLVSAPNLVQMFLGWEGVGVCSYLLIGFWHHKESANAAAMKAFIVNRVADAAMLVGLFLLLQTFGSLTYGDIFGQLGANTAALMNAVTPLFGYEVSTLSLAALLIFVGAMGKSAQFGLHTWLPDAMEGPTPVSALIHAATMVTAGVFLLCRLSPLYELTPDVLHIVAYVGALTAIFAATVGLTQTDIKRVIAYSTCSQLGYMFFAIGVSAYPAAMFHLTTHAFFKALLFLGAGSVIHAMHHEQNIFRMGGLKTVLPITYVCMWLGSLALAGIPPFAGFFSKDLILESAFMAPGGWAQPVYYVGALAAMLTAIYGFRIVFMAFEGAFMGDEKVRSHAHESPWVILGPMMPLAAGAVLAGLLLSPMGTLEWWQGAIVISHHHDALHAAHHTPAYAKYAPLLLAICGIAAAWYLFAEYRNIPRKLASVLAIPYAISLNKWYVDELYDLAVVRPTRVLAGWLYRFVDQEGIDGLVNGAADATKQAGQALRQTQTGHVAHYAFAMVMALVVGLGLLLWRVMG